MFFLNYMNAFILEAKQSLGLMTDNLERMGSMVGGRVTPFSVFFGLLTLLSAFIADGVKDGVYSLALKRRKRRGTRAPLGDHEKRGHQGGERYYESVDNAMQVMWHSLGKYGRDFGKRVRG